MTTRFTVGIIQDAVAAAAAETLDHAVVKIREAAELGGQIVCLQEMFNLSYFCKTQSCERFDIAEPIPGPVTDRMQALAKELAIVIIVPIFERQAAGIYRNSAAVIDADGALLGVYHKMHIPDDPLYNEKYYFTPGDTTQTYDDATPWRGRVPGLEDALRERRRADLLGSVVSGSGTHHGAARCRHHLLSDGDWLASIGAGGVR